MSFVLEIIAFFLFVGGFMYLLLSGRLADMFRDREPKPLLLIALISGCALYHWTSILSEPAAPEPPSTAPSTEVPEPSKPVPVTVRHKARAATSTQAPAPPGSEPEHWETIIIQEAAPQQVLAPLAADPAPSRAPTRSLADPYESKAKRGIKAVGRFLHLRKTEQ
jgi:hypothetical protein